MCSDLYLADCQAARPQAGSAMYNLGSSVRHGRLRLGLTVKQLAMVSEVPFPQIQRLEWHMCQDIDVLSVGRLCDALMCNLFVANAR
jgi:hypothetical protein